MVEGEDRLIFVVIELFEGGYDMPDKVDIKALHTGLAFPPINKVKLSDIVLCSEEDYIN